MKNASQKVKTDEILAARAICNSYSCLHFAFVLHENALVFSQSDARSFSCILLFMVIGPSGVQLDDKKSCYQLIRTVKISENDKYV